MKKKAVSTLVVIALVVALVGCSATGVTTSAVQTIDPENVKVEGGLVSGLKGDDGVISFKGIPYAAPPVGDLRWKEPQPVVAWEGVKKCDTFGNICPQTVQSVEFYQNEFYSDPYPNMSEDCLYLNVYTPAKASNEKLPVMVWIHGGGFSVGWSYEKEFDSDNLARKGVILVTVEYRLGIFGFMANPELTAESPNKSSGNYGLLDQIAALRWVKNNIAGFGGDANNVTVFGQSAGSMSAYNLSYSPLSAGLVNKAILQSGANAGTGLILSEAEKIGVELQTKLNCNSIADMREIPTMDLLNDTAGFRSTSVEVPGFGIFLAPNIDGYVLPATIDYPKIPFIIGYNTSDLDGMGTDAFDLLDKLAESGNNNIYAYEFARVLPGGDGAGAFHSAELWYVFQTTDKCWRPFIEADRTLADQIATYWTNFAKTGDPNGGISGWSKYTDDKFKMVFDISAEAAAAEAAAATPVPTNSVLFTFTSSTVTVDVLQDGKLEMKATGYGVIAKGTWSYDEAAHIMSITMENEPMDVKIDPETNDMFFEVDMFNGMLQGTITAPYSAWSVLDN